MIVTQLEIGPRLVITCLLLLMALGIFTVIYGVVWLAKAVSGQNSKVSIPFFGKPIEINGPAWLIIVAIGALMVASPLIVAFAQRPSDETKPPISVQRVQESERLPDENSPQFRFVSDLSILDLRRSQIMSWSSSIRALFSASERSRTKPSVLRNIMVIRKLGPTNNLILTYSTSGSLVVRCLSQPATYQEKKVTEKGVTTDTWAITVDVSALPVDTDFEVVIEATYYDAFSTSETSNFSTYANRQTDAEDLSVVLIFPDDKPEHQVTITEYPPDGGSGGGFHGIGREYSDPKGLAYYWTTTNTRPDYYYKLAWSW